MKPTNWTWCALRAAGVVLALGMSPAVFAQESLEERLARQEKQIEEIRKNAEVLQKQNEALMKLLSSGPAQEYLDDLIAAPARAIAAMLSDQNRMEASESRTGHDAAAERQGDTFTRSPPRSPQ